MVAEYEYFENRSNFPGPFILGFRTETVAKIDLRQKAASWLRFNYSSQVVGYVFLRNISLIFFIILPYHLNEEVIFRLVQVSVLNK